jgi:5-amino-6-(5-phospho-D-ribitylamino)uracil phosphatase
VPAIHVLAIDIDGTLLDSHGKLPPENREAIRRALAAGVHVALVTGRAFHFARPVADLLDLPVHLIVSNGAIVKALDSTTLMRRLMPADVARSVLAQTMPWRTDAALVFDRSGRQVVAGGMDWQHPQRAGYWKRNQAVIDEVFPLEDSLTEDPIQVMFNGGVERMRALALHLESSVASGGYQFTLTEYAARDFTMVDVLAAGVTKGTTLMAWARDRGYGRESIMAVGDNYNDREMLEAAGTPVVMGNAVAELLAAGYYVTDSNDAAGLAKAIARFIPS